MSSANAGGTGDAITIARLPCVPTTTLLVLSVTASNTTNAPTLTPTGGPTQVIKDASSNPVQVGQLAAGSRVLLTNNGVNWFVLAPTATTPTAALIAPVSSFGAKCDGSTDDTTALQAAINGAVGGQFAVGLPSGTCIFKSTITSNPGNNWGIIGTGSGSSALKYMGGSTNGNLLKLGNATSPSVNVNLTGFRVISGVKMTGGDAVYAGGLQESQFSDVYADNQFGSPGKNLWNGFDFDSINHLVLDHAMAYAQNDCVRTFSAAGNLVDLYISAARLGGGTGCAVGLHVGGGSGGVYLNSSSILLNNTNVVIDNALSTASNVQQVRIGEQSLIDTSNTGPGILVNQTVTGGSYEFTFDGWVSASAQSGIFVQSCPTCRINITGAPIQFNGVHGPPGDGIQLSDPNAIYTIGGAIYNNNFNGINCTAPITVNLNNFPHDNTSGGVDVSMNCSVVSSNENYCTTAGPLTTSSTTVVMMGLKCAFSVRQSHNVRFTLCGQLSNSATSDGGTLQIYYGTGTPPSLGAGPTGTATGFGSSWIPGTGVAGALATICVNELVFGITPNPQIWFDGAYAVGIGGTVSVANIVLTAEELK